MMTSAYQHYLEIVAGLKARRSAPGWKPEDDREDLAQLLELFEDLSAEERMAASASWL